MNKEIKYDRNTRDFACYVDGELIGFAKSYHDGEILCDQYVYDELARLEPVNACAGFGCVDGCGDCAPPADWPRELSTGKPMDWYAVKAAVESGALILRHSGLPNPLARIQAAELEASWSTATAELETALAPLAELLDAARRELAEALA